MEIYKFLISEYADRLCELSVSLADWQKRSRQSIVAYSSLKRLLAEKYGKSADEIDIERDKNGKPYCDLCSFFSITHTGDYVYIAINDKSVGVDAEMLRDIKDNLIKKTAHTEEVESILNSDDKNVSFITMWTVKEAYFKLKGTGITDLCAISENEIRRRYDVETTHCGDHILTTVTKRSIGSSPKTSARR